MPRRHIGKSVFDAALERMLILYEEGHTIVCSFSGGKDSTICLEICRMAAKLTNRLPVPVLMRDEEIMLPGTFEYCERVAADPDFDFHWIYARQPIINVFNREHPYWWVFDPDLDPSEWVRQPPDFAYEIAEKSIEHMITPERFPVPEGKELFAVIGLRVSESKGRLYGLFSSKGYTTKPGKYGVRKARPIYDWKDGDVWLAMQKFGWDYNTAYDAMARLGVDKKRMRIAPPTMQPMGVNDLQLAAKCWPQWFDSICKRVPGLRSASHFGLRVVRPQRRFNETWQECFMRTCIDEAPEWIGIRSKHVMEKVLEKHARHSMVEFPDVHHCERCSRNWGSWQKLAIAMYGGDPFCLKAPDVFSSKGEGALRKFIDPEYFRPGTGTWGGTPAFAYEFEMSLVLKECPVGAAEEAAQAEYNTTPEETQQKASVTRADVKGRKKVKKEFQTLERLAVEYVGIGDVYPNEWNPNRQSEHDFELLLRSMEDDGFCVAAHTPVLCADLVWRPAGELEVGQEIVAFDADKADGNKKHQRRFRTAEVTANGLFEDELYEVKVATGETVLCNADHPWLATRYHGAMEGRFNGEWCKTSDLLPGDEVYKIIEPWEVEKSYEAGWLSGFLDGEGCLSSEKTHNGSPVPVVRLSVTQKPGLTADRMKEAMIARCAGAEVSVWEHAERPNWQDNERVCVNQLGEIMSLLGSVRPKRLLESGGTFWDGRSIIGKGGTKKEVSSINKVGRGMLASLATSERTYIASGFAMHNTQPVIVNMEGKIIDGEHRWRAAATLGFTEIPVVRVEMDEAQMRISTIRHNRARGSHDVELEAEVLRDLQKLGAIEIAQDSLMLDDIELDRLLEDVSAPDAIAADDFSEAWVPETFHEEEKQIMEQEGEMGSRTYTDNAGSTHEVSVTPEAVAAQRKREELIAKAKTEHDKEVARKETKLYRVSLVYAGEESDIVKAALGDKPAQELLVMCKEKIGYTEPDPEAEEAPPESPGADGVIVEG